MYYVNCESRIRRLEKQVRAWLISPLPTVVSPTLCLLCGEYYHPNSIIAPAPYHDSDTGQPRAYRLIPMLSWYIIFIFVYHVAWENSSLSCTSGWTDIQSKEQTGSFYNTQCDVILMLSLSSYLYSACLLHNKLFFAAILTSKISSSSDL